MGIIGRLVDRTVGLLEGVIERLGDPHGSLVMEEALRRARDRGAELAVENARLQDEVDSLTTELDDLRDRRTVLYADEIRALGVILDYTSAWHGPTHGVLQNLVRRAQCDERTLDQANRQIHAVIMGRTFDPEECASDDELSRPTLHCHPPCPECLGETDGDQ